MKTSYHSNSPPTEIVCAQCDDWNRYEPITPDNWGTFGIGFSNGGMMFCRQCRPVSTRPYLNYVDCPEEYNTAILNAKCNPRFDTSIGRLFYGQTKYKGNKYQKGELATKFTYWQPKAKKTLTNSSKHT